MAGKLSHRLLSAVVVVSCLLAVGGPADVYAETVATPSFTPGGGTYNDEQSVAVTCATPGATIHYTVNGVDPTESDPAVEPNVPVFVEHNLTLKAKAWKDGLEPSAVRSTTYTLKVATPAFSKSTATYNMEQDVLVTCATPEATIHYTTNGIDPTESDPVIEPNVPILVDHSLTLKAKAWKGAMTPSNIRSATYTLVVTTPTFLPGGGTYNSEQSIVVACSTPGATIHYRIGETADANVVPSPTQSDPVIASGGQIFVDHTQTIKFRAWKGELDASGIAVGTYYMVTATPEITPSGGSYANELYATVTCATPGATIHYTTNGVDPTQSDPVITSGDSVYVNHSLVLKAKAWEGALAASSVQARTYTLQVGRPSFQPGGGTYSSEQNVVITCVTAGATIHYTTNGVDPTESDPVIASGSSVYVDHSLVLKAKAWKGSLTPSTVRSMTYTLQVAQPSFSPGGGTYNCEQDVVVTCATAGATIHYTTSGIDPTESDPVIASGGSIPVNYSLTLKARAWKGSLTPSNTKLATYNLVVAAPVFDPNGGICDAEQSVIVTCATTGATIHYTLEGHDPNESDPVIASGGSVLIDSSLTLKARAYKADMTASIISSATYSFEVEAPVLSPASGTYYPSVNVAATCATPGATVHYTISETLDVNAVPDPTESDPIVEPNVPILVDRSMTLKAKAWRSELAPSDITAGTYTISPLQEIVIGTGTTTWDMPLKTNYYDARTQTIYLASEIGGPYSFQSLALDVTTLPGQVMNNFTIRMKHVNTAPTWWESSGWTTVYQANQSISTTGWVQFNFSTPFLYNGSQNLLIDICFDNSSASPAGYCRCSTTDSNRSAYGYAYDTEGSPLSWSADMYTSTRIPNIKLVGMVLVPGPVFSPGSGIYPEGQEVMVTCSLAGATIHYTTNGVDPTESDPVVASGSTLMMPVGSTTMLKARAFKDDYAASEVALAVYRTSRNIIYVKDGNDPGDGLSWATAKTTLQAALDMAVMWDEIWVAAGTYRPTSDYGLVAGSGQVQDRLKHFRMKNGVGIYGGFIGNETSREQRIYGANPTVLSGDIGVVGDPCDNCYHVFYMPATLGIEGAILDGFTVTGGYGRWGWSGAHDYGGGMYVESGDITLSNCLFSGNTAAYGGGIYAYQNKMAVSECRFTENSAWYGGGIHASVGDVAITGCQFDGNYGINGGGAIYSWGVNSLIVNGCTLSGNEAETRDPEFGFIGFGGAVYAAGGNRVSVTDCNVMDNVAWDGGGILAAAVSTAVTNCRFEGNHAVGRGGAVRVGGYGCTAELTNCVFHANHAPSGSGVLCYESDISIMSCTFGGNSDHYGGVVDNVYAEGTISMTNSVMWDPDDSGTATEIYGSISASYSDIRGGCSGTGNINADPLFVDLAGGDLRLRVGSPCIDAGNNADVNSPTDLAGNPRISDGDGDGTATVDMGAYERQCVTNPVGDVSYDCGVEFADYAMLLGRWGQSGCSVGNWWCYRADVDESGVVDMLDMAAIVEHWLEGVAAGGN